MAKSVTVTLPNQFSSTLYTVLAIPYSTAVDSVCTISDRTNTTFKMNVRHAITGNAYYLWLAFL
ncbi:MAG: hypothetical protein ABFC34_02565 [Methanobacterium sp.]